MDNDKKDKIIIALAILIVLTLSYNFVNKKENEDFIVKGSNASISSLSNEFDGENKDKVNTNNSESNGDFSIKVHISGEVKNPGVYTVDKNDRLDDLVNDAGGLSDKADIDRINLALRLKDQMRIIIPNVNDKENDNNQIDDKALGIIDGVDNENSDKVNINTADQTTLMTLPNIGEKRALAIIEYRENNKFNKIEDIKNVSGIGDKYFEAMKDMIVVD